MSNIYIIGRYNISTEINGKVYNGYYTEENGMITVNYKDYSEPAQKSFCNNDVLAKIILGELVRKSENT